jgi:hypothetical protein
MSERDPIQVTAPAQNNSSIIARGEQLSLLADSPEPMPVAPSPGTLAARMLGMLAAGEALTSPEFEDRTGSWRGAAYVFQLAAMGWLIVVERIPAPAPDRPERWIARYRLDRRQIAIARGLRVTWGAN